MLLFTDIKITGMLTIYGNMSLTSFVNFFLQKSTRQTWIDKYTKASTFLFLSKIFGIYHYAV